jgi:hypothetical protein
MQLVKFKNGKYGIRKRNLFDKIFKREGLFRDFNPILVEWRSSSDRYFEHCQLYSFEEVVNIFNNINSGVIEEIIIN